MVPEEAGQLVVYIYQMMMVYALNRLMNGKECINIKGVGL